MPILELNVARETGRAFLALVLVYRKPGVSSITYCAESLARDKTRRKAVARVRLER